MNDDISKLNRRILISIEKGFCLIDSDTILYLEADGCYCKIHTITKKPILASVNLGRIEHFLDPNIFFRSHHSIIVNLNYIEEVITKGGLYIILKGGFHTPLSRRKSREFLKIIKNKLCKIEAENMLLI